MKKIFCIFFFISILMYAKSQINLDSVQRILDKEEKSFEVFTKYLTALKNTPNEDLELKELIGNWILSSADSTKEEELIAETYTTLGNSFVWSNDNKKAADYATKALKIAEKKGYYKIECDALGVMSNVFYRTDQIEKSIEYNKKVIDLAEQNNYKHGLAVGKFNYGASLSDANTISKEDFWLSKKLKLEAISIMKELKDTQNIIRYTLGLGETYSGFQLFDSANSIFKSTYTLLQAVTNKSLIVEYFFIIGKNYNLRGRTNNDSKEDFIKSNQYLDSSLAHALHYNNSDFIANCYIWMTSNYKRLDDYKNAYKYRKMYDDIHDSINNSNNFRAIADINNRYEKVKKDSEIYKLKVSNIQKSNLNKILMGSATFLLLLSFLGYRNFKTKQKLEKFKITQLQKEAVEKKFKLNLLENQQLKNKLETEQIVNYFSNSLINKNTVDSTLWDVAKNLIGKLDFEDCMMYLWNDSKTKMIQKAGYGPKGSIEEINKNVFDVLPGQGVVGYVINTKQHVLIDDTSIDSRYRMDEMNRLSEIAVPILYNNELIGIIDSEHSEKNFFTERHLNILHTIAGMIAIKIKTIESETALHNAQIKLLQINEELQQKQLLATEAMLQGQEDERCRLAKDLHDGLGGMLNGVKIKFNNMKEDLVLTAENAEIFERSINQLDASIAELRKVSHNLMPDGLVRFGLTEALKDYCNQLQTSAIKITFQQLGAERQLNNTANLYVYRMIQELVANALKHANATQILAQLTIDTDKILITVDDDGKGFNTTDLINNKGVGMQSIKQRVDYLKGTIVIDSKPGKGSSINIELKV